MRTVLLVMRADLVARSAINQAADPSSFKPVHSCCLLLPSCRPAFRTCMKALESCTCCDKSHPVFKHLEHTSGISLKRS